MAALSVASGLGLEPVTQVGGGGGGRGGGGGGDGGDGCKSWHFDPSGFTLEMKKISRVRTRKTDASGRLKGPMNAGDAVGKGADADQATPARRAAAITSRASSTTA